MKWVHFYPSPLPVNTKPKQTQKSNQELLATILLTTDQTIQDEFRQTKEMMNNEHLANIDTHPVTLNKAAYNLLTPLPWTIQIWIVQ
jgi:hypothetical protein